MQDSKDVLKITAPLSAFSPLEQSAIAFLVKIGKAEVQYQELGFGQLANPNPKGCKLATRTHVPGRSKERTDV